jgi:hypothetical protein
VARHHPRPDDLKTPGTCAACGRPVVLVADVHGEAVWLDPETHADGDVALLPAGAMRLPPDLVARYPNVGVRYVRHETSCPGREAAP